MVEPWFNHEIGSLLNLTLTLRCLHIKKDQTTWSYHSQWAHRQPCSYPRGNTHGSSRSAYEDSTRIQYFRSVRILGSCLQCIISMCPGYTYLIHDSEFYGRVAVNPAHLHRQVLVVVVFLAIRLLPHWRCAISVGSKDELAETFAALPCSAVVSPWGGCCRCGGSMLNSANLYVFGQFVNG
jgi:hypothetical protein